ncbi:kinase-like domain-containing protein [Lentinula raphanica]|nr:kinase-like domain-containing protein [Lentinula raphanica]
MVDNRSHHLSSSSSTWSSSIHTGSTWAVRPSASSLFTTVRRKASRLLNEKPSHSQVPGLQTSSSDSLLNNFNEPSPDSERTIRAAQIVSTVSPLSPVLPSFQWIRGDLIGAGSYGRVYWSLNITTGDIIAVKQVELARNPSKRQKESIEALKFESNTLRDLDHPNIVQFLGFEESTDHLSMQYVAGGSIGSCLKAHGRFNDEVTKAFARQMLEGLEYLHIKGIIHRDIKADNILVDKSGMCKISDFGISKQAEGIDGRAFTEMRGTVYWMAPEAVNPKDNGGGYDAKVDIWSIGCVVLEMWTGRRPWYGEEVVSVLLKLYGQKLPPAIPPELLLSDEAMDFREKAFAMQERPSATMLKRHPYLTMKPGWTFRLSDIEGPADSRDATATIRHSKSHTVIADRTIRHVRSNKTLPPLPTSSNSSLASSSKLRLDVNTPPPPRFTPPSFEGPPIVYIHPLRSPATPKPRQPHVYEESASSPSTTSSSRVSNRRKRHTQVIPVVSSLNTSHHSPRRVPSTPVLNTQSIVKSSRTRPASSAIDVPGTYSDSDDESSTWRKLPQVAERKRMSAWERPLVEDIYENMQQFFPHHDIDQPIVNEGKSGPQDKQQGGLQPKKSIRMVAEQRVSNSDFLDRKSNRVTKLWGSRLEELESTKSGYQQLLQNQSTADVNEQSGAYPNEQTL